MATFPKTSYTLIERIKTLAPGEDGAAWTRFWDLYAPAIRAYAVYKGGEEHADDIVVTVLSKLVDVLRQGRFDAAKGAFHAYLGAMVYNEVHMFHRKDVVRHRQAHVPIDETMSETLAAPAGANDEEDWRRAVLAAAVEHVLTKTAISDRDRDLYEFHVRQGHSLDETVDRFKLTRNHVCQIKLRLEKRIASVGREMVRRAEAL